MDDSTAYAPTCSVIVCTRNRPEALNRCLGALAEIAYPRFDVLVVDNAPSDGSARTVAKRWGARYLVELVPGLSRARNAGARACSADIVAFTDDDAVPEPEWLSRLAAEFRDPRVIAVTGRTLPLLRDSDTVKMSAYASDLGPEKIRLDRSHPLWFEMASFGGIGRGCNMAFRRCAFDRWSGFDERLGRGALLGGAEEHRAFAHLLADGYAVTYTPEAVVRHPIPQTLQKLRAQYLSSLSDVTGYALFLFLVTRYKWKVSRYVIEAALGTKRAWRFQAGALPPDLVPRSRRLLACLRGPWRCLEACVRTSHRPSHALLGKTMRRRATAEAKAGVLNLVGK